MATTAGRGESDRQVMSISNSHPNSPEKEHNLELSRNSDPTETTTRCNDDDSISISSNDDSDDGTRLRRNSVTHPDEGLKPIWCSCIVVNYISAGYILLPHAFSQAGLAYSAFIFSLVALQSYVTSMFLLETCARAESLENLTVSGQLPRQYSMEIRTRKFELPLLQELFLGQGWSKFFLLMTACDLYGITWTLCSIFGSALADSITVFGDDTAESAILGAGDWATSKDYKFFVGIFAVLTIPLSCTGIIDQAFLQFVFLFGRIIMVLLMVGTLVAAIISPNDEHFAEADSDVLREDAPWIDLSHTMTIIQTAIFSTAYQFSVPAIGSISRNKQSMKGIFQNAVAFMYSSNLLVAILVAYYFGTSTQMSSNLNWLEYQAGGNGWSTFVSKYIVFFAALDGLAVFPLLCVCLGDILLQGYFGHKAHNAQEDVKLRTAFRLLACIPQTIGALFVSDLGILARYAGLFTMASYSAAPAVLYLASGKHMDERGLPRKTFYSSNFISSDNSAYFILALVVLVAIGVVTDSIIRNL